MRHLYEEVLAWVGPEKVGNPKIIEEERICVQCGQEFSIADHKAQGAQFLKYCSLRCRSKSKGMGERGFAGEQRRETARVKRKVADHRAHFLAWKLQGCSKCGEKDPACIDAHHINPDDKKNAYDVVSRNIRSSSKRFYESLAKCVPLCKNCHAKHHAYEEATDFGVDCVPSE